MSGDHPALQSDADLRAESAVLAGSAQDEATTRHLLHEHVPISLIMDMASPAGPDSRAILNDEGQPEQEWWEEPASS